MKTEDVLSRSQPGAMRSAGARSLDSVYGAIENYYTAKVSRHGATPLGVDWTCIATQELRFVQLLKLCEFAAPFSLNDLGCGYGALLAYLAKRHASAAIDYLGIDLSAPEYRLYFLNKTLPRLRKSFLKLVKKTHSFSSVLVDQKL